MSRVRTRRLFLFGAAGLLSAFVLLRPNLAPLFGPLRRSILGGKSVVDRLEEFGGAARERMRPAFDSAGVAYPPSRLTLVAVKSERILYVYAGENQVLAYPVQGQSGVLGPKLREGDLQVPEGIYVIEGFNPNSRFYVSLRLNYPNAFDQEKATAEGRDQPGSDIYIHGRSASIGCLAMGDPAIEELFTLIADVGMANVEVVITPIDFRTAKIREDLPKEPAWIGELYERIESRLAAL